MRSLEESGSETERMAVSRGWAGGKRSYYLTGNEVQFDKMRRVLPMVSGNDSKEYECVSCPPAVDLHVIKMVYFMLRVFYHDC